MIPAAGSARRRCVLSLSKAGREAERVLRFVVRRLLLMIPVLFGLSVLLFIWVRALPGDPARSLLGRQGHAGVGGPGQRAVRLRQAAASSSTSPTSARCSRATSAPRRGPGSRCSGTFLDRFPATIELALAAMLFAIVVGIPLGYAAAKRAGGALDFFAVGGSLLGVVIPVFVLAYLLKIVFAVGLSGPLGALAVLPASGRQDPRIDATHITNFYVLDGLITREWDAAWDAILHLILPAHRPRLDPAGDHRPDDPGLGAGGAERGLRPHRPRQGPGPEPDHPPACAAQRDAAGARPPSACTTGALLAGAVLTESVFAFNGIGSYLFDAISTLDFAVLQGFILFIAVVYALVNLVVDLGYGVIDPRLRTR